MNSHVEILNISPHGIWLFAKGKEYFLSHADFPWFKNACLADIFCVRLVHGRFLRWEKLDVDLALDSLKDPNRYPLQYRHDRMTQQRDRKKILLASQMIDRLRRKIPGWDSAQEIRRWREQRRREIERDTETYYRSRSPDEQ